MKTLSTEGGFSLLHVALTLAILGVVGFTGWYVWSANQEAGDDASTSGSGPTASTKSKALATNKYTVPSGYSVYKENGLSFAYPEQWKASATEEFITVINDNEAAIYQGCGDESCAVKYDSITKDWENADADSGTEVVARDGQVQAYLIPIKGAFNCGSSAAMVHVGSKFAKATLSVCTRPLTDDEFQPSGNQLLYDDVMLQLKEVVKSVNKL